MLTLILAGTILTIVVLVICACVLAGRGDNRAGKP